MFILIGVAAPLFFTNHATRQIPTGSGWVRWDAQWFIGTAEHGYPWKLFPQLAYSSTAFFPLYPLLIRLVSATGLQAGVAAMLISNIAFLCALYYLYRLVRLDQPAPVATRTLWLLAVFPTALFFFLPYTESLYVLCAVLTLWYLRRQRWPAAGMAGALGALTRQSGLVLLLPYLVEWFAAYRQHWSPVRSPLAAIRALLPVLLMPLAVAAQLTYLWHLTGSPLAFLQEQRTWHRRLAWPWDGIVATVQRWGLPDITGHETGHHVHIVMELGAIALFLPLLAVGARQMRPSYTVYAGAVWLAALISPAIADNYWLPVMSSSRFALSVVPSFIVLALLLRRPQAYQIWLTASAMGLSFLATYYVLGGWVA
jgi:hypothetical protein